MFLIFDSNEEETRVESNATESNKGQSEKCQVNKFLNQGSLFGSFTLIIRNHQNMSNPCNLFYQSPKIFFQKVEEKYQKLDMLATT